MQPCRRQRLAARAVFALTLILDITDVRAADEPVGTLELRDALAAALARNPDLAAFSAEVRAQDARTVQAGMLPNPELRTDLENVGGSGDRKEFEDTESTLRLSQLFELGGKRGKRRRIAELGRDVATWDYEAKRLSVLAETTKAFVTTLADQERLALAVDAARLAAETVKAAEALVAAGASPPTEVTRARVALGRAEVDCGRAERDLTAARAALAASWGGRGARFSAVSGSLATPDQLPTREELDAQIEQNPDVARWQTVLDERAASLALERARRIPDVTVGAGGRHFSDNGDNVLVLDLTLPLPVFDRNQGGIAEAEHRLSKAGSERDAAEVSVRSALTTAYERLVAAQGRASALERSILPEARAALEGARDGFRKGLFRLLDVLDPQRTLFDLRREYLDALEAFHLAAADVERLPGDLR